jgi:redox-sensitive bicupin YhaK (pirin superfamily)
MTLRKILKSIPAQRISEGAGVTVHRTIGTQPLRHLDPFLMLDHFGSDNPNEYIAGFPDHPHRGFTTFTYMLNGHMLHKDSMGNTGHLTAGSAQWMKAASGVIHSEMPQQDNGLMRGFQLWINLPASEKMSAPEYQEYSSQVIPEVKQPNITVRILCGSFNGTQGKIQDPHTNLNYLDVSLEPDAEFTIQTEPQHTCFVYVFEGCVRSDQETLHQHNLTVFTEGQTLTLKSDDSGARFIFVSGQPIGEPIVQYGPFVMNTRNEIETAFHDYQTGQLVRSKAKVHSDSTP